MSGVRSADIVREAQRVDALVSEIQKEYGDQV